MNASIQKTVDEIKLDPILIKESRRVNEDDRDAIRQVKRNEP